MKIQNSVRAVLVYESWPEQNESESSAKSNSPPSAKLKEISLAKLKQAFGTVPVFSNVKHKEEGIIELDKGEGQSLGACLEAVQKKTCQAENDSIALCYGFYPYLT